MAPNQLQRALLLVDRDGQLALKAKGRATILTSQNNPREASPDRRLTPNDRRTSSEPAINNNRRELGNEEALYHPRAASSSEIPC